jgi:hypothetical protein
MNHWIENCYTRLLIDNHISEDDPGSMTRFDPSRYVSLVKKAGVEASMVYACDHNGNCYYPTRVGHMHQNLAGRDIFGETVSLLRSEGIYPIAYYTSIYHNHSAKNHPAWRMQDIAGVQHSGRYWWSCPNSADYAAFTEAQVGEIINYDVDGIFIDMTFWPVICCCPNCRAKFRSLTGREIPETIDWNDPTWIAFQRFREQSMVTFCEELTSFIKSKKDITVTFQNSPIIFGWSFGQTPGIANACDYASGDFYGGKYQHILGAKILSAASAKQPFEYMTSRCIDLTDHTSMKSEETLRCEAATTLASGGAYFFIDAINPDGTLMDSVYERLGRVSTSLASITAKMKEHRPVLTADTGLYFSMSSLIDPAANGQALRGLPAAFISTSTPGYEEMLGTSILLTKNHRPFIVVRNAEGDLSRLTTLIVNNAQVLSADEENKIRDFVNQGGTLIATGLTSLMRPDGSGTGLFALEDVLGVSYTGKMSKRVNYLELPGEEAYVSCSSPAPYIRLSGAEQLAGLAEPLFDPDDPVKYASIHSNPPGGPSVYPGLTIHPYGKGRAIYLAPSLFKQQLEAQQAFGIGLLREYAPPTLVSATNAPVCVEITILRSTTADAYLVGLVNYQKELPNVPVHAIQVSLNLHGKAPVACICISSGQKLPFKFTEGTLQFEVPYLETIEMVEII